MLDPLRVQSPYITGLSTVNPVIYCLKMDFVLKCPPFDIIPYLDLHKCILNMTSYPSPVEKAGVTPLYDRLIDSRINCGLVSFGIDAP